jgi:hypothetical protein
MVSLLNNNILNFHTYIHIFIHRSIINMSQIECGICHEKNEIAHEIK